ncbi:MAG: DUF4214 domain-containing protein [Acidimicrobiales bacterium]
MSLTMELTDRVASIVERRTSRRGFIGRTALVGSALAVTGPAYVLRPGTAYAAICRCPRQSTGSNTLTCGCGDLCCDGYTEFCCHLYGQNSCPPQTLLAGWWKVDNSSFCDGAARYYMDCNQEAPQCSCGSRGVCRDNNVVCQCRSCGNRADGCTSFRYGNCNNDVACVGPIVCRVVTCTKPWEIDPGCSMVARTDPATANHSRPCLATDYVPPPFSGSWVRAAFEDYVGREPSDNELGYYSARVNNGDDRSGLSVALAKSDVYIGAYLEGLYQAVFGRSIDDSGKAFWTQQVINGLNPAALASNLYASDEFFEASGSIEAFVGRLYRLVLGREPDDEGVAYWSALVEMGDDRVPVTTAFYGSIESRRSRVAALYQKFLGRDAEPDGLEYWAEILRDGDDLRLATYLSGSQEYLERAGRRFPE